MLLHSKQPKILTRETLVIRTDWLCRSRVRQSPVHQARLHHRTRVKTCFHCSKWLVAIRNTQKPPTEWIIQKAPTEESWAPTVLACSSTFVHTDCMNLATKNQPSPKSGVPRVCVPISVCMYACMYVPTYKTKAVYLHWSCSMKPLKLLKKFICNQPSGEKSKKKLQKIQDLSQMSTLQMRWQLLPKTHENMGIYDWSEILDLQIYSWHTTWMLGVVSDTQNIWELKSAG